jgi:hypothetical protein
MTTEISDADLTSARAQGPYHGAMMESNQPSVSLLKA